MEKILQYIDNNKEKFINDLIEILKIKTISSDEAYKDEIIHCSHYLIERLKELGFDNVKILNETGHPIIYGERIVNPDFQTVLIYGHYDVQPVDPIEKWNNPPFEPIIIDNKIYARGATDDKGQFLTHFKSIESFINTGSQLPVNIKFLIEGEEEVGSTTLYKIIKEYKELLTCDVILISDTSLYSEKIPSITCSLRGLAYFQLELTGPSKDLHSGTYGGAVHNPIEVLSNILSKMKDKNGKVLIPHFYDDVIKLSKKDREEMSKLKFSDNQLKKELGVKELFGEKGYTSLERITARPTFEINGIWGGYTRQGAKTVIPSKAFAKVSMRLVANQSEDKISKLFVSYIKKITPKSVNLKIEKFHGGEPAFISPNNKYSVAAGKAMEKSFLKYPIFSREGGSIPIVVEFIKILKAPAILMGFGLDSEDAHSPNEHFNLDHYIKGIKCSALFFDEVSKL